MFCRYDALRNSQHHEEHQTETHAGDGRQFLGEQVYQRGREQHHGDDAQTNRNFHPTDVDVSRHFPFPLFRRCITQNQYRQRHEREAPDHAEGIQRRQEVHVATAGDDGQDLQQRNHVDHAVTGTELLLRLLKPRGKNAVFHHPAQHAVGADDCRVHRARQDERTHQYHKSLEDQLHGVRTHDVHGQSADEVGVVVGTLRVRDDHHREKRHQRGEEQAVQEDHQPGLFQVLQLGMFDFAIDLGQGFLAAHGQHGVTEANQQHDDRDLLRPRAQQPSQRLAIVVHVGGRGKRRKLSSRFQNRNEAPDDEHDHHDGGDFHDLQRPVAGLTDALYILPPEIGSHNDGEDRTERVLRDVNVTTDVVEGIDEETSEILPGGHGTDRPCQHVIKQQRGNGEFGQRPAQRLFDHAVHAAAHEHRAGLDIQSAHGVAEDHHREHEPRSALADHLFGIAAHVIRGRGQVGQHNGGGAPERDKRQHHRGGDENLYYWPLQIWNLRGHKGRSVPESTVSLSTGTAAIGGKTRQ